MIKCPSCGHENVPGTQFCEGCGEELAQDNGATASASATPQAMIKCPACDNMNPADNVACEVCGAELSGASGTPSAASADAATSTVANPPGDSSALPIAPIPADLADPAAGALSSGTVPLDASIASTPPLPDLSMPTSPVAPPVPPTPPIAPTPLPPGDLAP